MVSCTLLTFSNLNRSKSSTQTNPLTPRSWHFLLLSTQANSVECCATELPPSINKKKKVWSQRFFVICASLPLSYAFLFSIHRSFTNGKFHRQHTECPCYTASQYNNTRQIFLLYKHISLLWMNIVLMYKK